MKGRLNFKPTGQELLRVGSHKLREAGIENALKEAKILLSFAMDYDYSDNEILFNPVTFSGKIRNFFSALDERIKRKPIAKIIGKKMFFKDEFMVNEYVLDPRPETETLVSTALENNFSSVLDLGTGSGCILISLLKENIKAYGLGVDISRNALDIAQKNSKLLGVSDRATFMESNWFGKVTSKFDLIVSNPPYISSEELVDLGDEVVRYDPQIALSGGDDGLESFKIITRKAYKYLNPGGILIFEVGYSQSMVVKELFCKAGFINIKLVKDLELKERVVVGALPT